MSVKTKCKSYPRLPLIHEREYYFSVLIGSMNRFEFACFANKLIYISINCCIPKLKITIVMSLIKAFVNRIVQLLQIEVMEKVISVPLLGTGWVNVHNAQ